MASIAAYRETLKVMSTTHYLYRVLATGLLQSIRTSQVKSNVTKQNETIVLTAVLSVITKILLQAKLKEAII
jgi:hypothetical protein